MGRVADVVVVGGGCIGASIVYHLARQGVRRALLLEKNQLASGSTGRSSAIIRQHYPFPAVARMARKSLGVFERFGEIIGGECGFVRTGYVAAVGPADADALAANVRMLQGVGIQTQLLTPRELQTLIPELEVGDLGRAAYEPDSGYADPHATTTAFAARARALGAEILQGITVRRIRQAAGRVTGVTTDAGEVGAPAVILATNAWTLALARSAGIEIPIRPLLHEVAILVRPAASRAGHPAMADFVQGAYFRPEGEDMTLVGDIPHDPTAVVDPDGCPDRARPEAMARFARVASGRFPALAGAGYKRAYAAFYDVSPDNQLILDRLPGLEGGYLACGFSGRGFKPCPANNPKRHGSDHEQRKAKALGPHRPGRARRPHRGQRGRIPDGRRAPQGEGRGSPGAGERAQGPPRRVVRGGGGGAPHQGPPGVAGGGHA
ncbi:MAG TPA: FAD-binding oxidoreductase, partial [Candidatus Methylomirabilis sp.]|nr:FAD-binding oxidoreductase [Candidatus Methylomirabilis sp.]